MIVSEYIKPIVDIFIEQCNFIGCEQQLFELRSQGEALESIAEKLDLSVDGAKKTSQKVDKKIDDIIIYALLALKRH